jgi:hypothetical protein
MLLNKLLSKNNNFMLEKIVKSLEKMYSRKISQILNQSFILKDINRIQMQINNLIKILTLQKYPELLRPKHIHI